MKPAHSPDRLYDVVYVTRYTVRYLKPARHINAEYTEAAEIQRQIRAQNAEISKRPKQPHNEKARSSFKTVRSATRDKDKQVRFQLYPKDEVLPGVRSSRSEYCKFCGRF